MSGACGACNLLNISAKIGTAALSTLEPKPKCGVSSPSGSSTMAALSYLELCGCSITAKPRATTRKLLKVTAERSTFTAVSALMLAGEHAFFTSLKNYKILNLTLRN